MQCYADNLIFRIAHVTKKSTYVTIDYKSINYGSLHMLIFHIG